MKERILFTLTNYEKVLTGNSTSFTNSPPKKEWVGLTDEEILIIYNTHTDANEWGYERAIEEKLKEKNT